MEKTTIQLAWTRKNGMEYYASIDVGNGVEILGSSCKDEKTAAKDAVKEVLKFARLGKECDESYSEYMIGCNDGTILHVRWDRGAYCYWIFGAGLGHASGCITHEKKIDPVIELARNHASQSYGGVAWEHRK